jgi:4-amino-4-deoxy-L-arabinose transferase-like glycosyltransferase
MKSSLYVPGGADPAPAAARPAGLDALYARPLPWLLLLAAAHVVARVAISPAFMWDEAQQILWTQELALGYGAQPPLYTWLQWGVNQLFGPNVLALALLKFPLIALVYVLMWLAASELLGRRAAWWAAASLCLLPPFGWYAISDLTHTVLVAAMTCAAWWLLLRIVRLGGSGCRREFAALGLVCGCGLLAKYSFALMLGAAMLALLSVRGPRRALLGRGWWLAVLIAVLIALPHGWWLLSHWRVATDETVRVMSIAPRHAWGVGLSDLLEEIFYTLGLWVIVALAAFGSRWWRRPGAAPEIPGWPAHWLRPVFGRYLALIAMALLGMVFVANVTVFKNRWMLPLLLPVPLMAFALRPELEAHGRGGKRFACAALALALAALAAAAAQPWLAYADRKPHPVNYPARELARALQNAGYDGRGRIIAADHLLAGMLRARFPLARADFCRPEQGEVAACVAANAQKAEQAGQGWLLISFDRRVPPGWWEQALARMPGGGELPRGRVSLPFHTVRPGQPPARYDFVWRPAAAPASGAAPAAGP